MAPATRPPTGTPSIRAALARERLNVLPDNQVVYVDRLGPRILAVPSDPTVSLSRQTLRELNKGNLTGRLAEGARFSSKRMMQCPEITISANGQYTVQKKNSDPNAREPRTFTVKTLDIWTGKPGELHEGRNIEDIIFYSVGKDLLPSYYCWKDDKMKRRENSLELERQQVAAMAEQELVESTKAIADVVDEYKEECEAKTDEDIFNDPENMLRFKPNILPSDPAWEGVEEYFKWVLNFKREDPEAPQVHRILQDELLESQLLLAIPAITSGYRAKIQDEHTKRYHEALQTTFRGKPDNLVTKLTMLCFGLPIEPLTVSNIKFAGGLEDVPAEDNGNFNGQIIERIVWSEKPLEFLDYYNQRSYGYPMIRMQKRKFEGVDAETIECILAQEQERVKNPQLIWDGCGFAEMNELEQDLHLRGGAGNSSEAPRMTYWLYTDMGRFMLDVHHSYGTFSRLAERLFQLKSRGNWAVQIDILPVVNDNSGDTMIDSTREITYWQWCRNTKDEYQPELYESYITMAMETKVTPRLRARYNSIYPSALNPADPVEPQDSQSVVNLQLQDIGVAYWFLPSSPNGINMLQDTFRNAIECLLPQHKRYRVQWVISGTEGKPSSSGELVLIAEAPSMDLWNATQDALGSLGRVTIHIVVIEEAPMQVKILIPGFKQVGWYTRLPEDRISLRNPDIFGAIRNLARQRTAPSRPSLRIWAGLEHYDDPENLNRRETLSMVLPAEEDLEVEEDIWQSEFLALTWDAVVVTPAYNTYLVICLTDQEIENVAYETCPSEELRTSSGVLTLDRFRSCVRRISKGFNLQEEYISIEQQQGGHIFLIGPGMTEYQWQTQVFDWLDSNTILYRKHQNWTCTYSKELIEGPLGPTHNGVPPGVRPRPRTPPLLEDVPLVTAGEKKIPRPFLKVSKKISTTASTSRPTQGPTGGPLTESTIKRLSKPRTRPLTRLESTKSGVAPVRNDPLSRTLPKTLLEGYDTYRKQQAVQEVARVEAYTQDQTIYRDGDGPEIPMFGPALEGSISVAGQALPTVYNVMSTPTENTERDKELEALRKIVLERLDYCGICQTALPGGPHNFEERERHFQQHRDTEVEARRRTPGSFVTITQASTPGIFYCEYCGKTPAEFKNEDNGEKHGPHCAQRKIFNDVPHYCQYCRLNFWDNNMTSETAISHVQNCANSRRVSPEGQVILYQQLLSRVVGNGQSDGEFTCHFEGCQLIFNSGTTNLAKATHFWEHLDHNDNEAHTRDGGKVCPFENCNIRLNDTTNDHMISHLREHIGRDDNDICPIPECAMHLDGLTREQVMTHLLTHARQACQWPDCEYVAAEKITTEATLEEKRQHLMWHVRQFCPWTDCKYQFLENAPQRDIEQHLMHEHVLGCQWPKCNHRFRREDDDKAVRDHYLAHADQPGTQGPEAQGQSTLEPSSPRQNPLVGGPPGQNPPSEDQNNIPPRLKALHPGQDFYCPRCFYKVSGGNASACKRHRGAPCNVIGHITWLIGTEADRKKWKANPASAGNAANSAAPKKTTPRKHPGKGGAEDPTYRPPAGVVEEAEDDDEEEVEGGDRGSGRKGPRKGERKRKRKNEEVSWARGKGKEGGGSAGGNEAGRSSSPKKKQKRTKKA